MINSGKEWDWLDDETKKQIEATKLADEISFRLLATKDHPEYEWLVKRLEEVLKK
jgi:hypothetical protein|tara:strand:- start:308 stop:472 length:165 start_codon:yes stop_codon:yes gene_type:complete